MHYLGFDLETGGLDKKKHTITEAYFAVWNDKWILIDELHLFMKNDKGEIIGEEEAFKITGIDPKKLLESPDTITYTEGRNKLFAMLEKHKIPNKRIHYKMLGQNIIAFDVPFMQEQGFLSEIQMKKAGIHHNAIDTTAIITWLKDMDILPSNVGSLSSLIEYFNLPKGTAHRAKDDVLMQKDVYVKLCELFKQNAIANLGVSSDLIKIVEF